MTVAVWTLVDEFYVHNMYLCVLNSIKRQGRRYSGHLSLQKLVSFPPQVDHVLVDLFSSTMLGELCWRRHPITQYHT